MSGSGEGISDKSKSVHMHAQSPTGRVVDQAEKGFACNGDSYDAHRPGYTDEVVELIANTITSGLASLGGVTKYNVLELGAGTGKLTQQLVKKLPASVSYLATEQSSNFLDTLKAKDLGVDTALACAESLSLPEGSVETVVCGQCFHWFSDARSLAEIRRVMVPGGKLVMVWNVNIMEDGWMKAMGEHWLKVIKKVGGSLKHFFQTGEWQKDIEESPLFSLERRLHLAGSNMTGDINKIMSNISTISAYNMLPEDERKSYLDELRQIIETWPGVDPQNLTMLKYTLCVTYVAL